MVYIQSTPIFTTTYQNVIISSTYLGEGAAHYLMSNYKKVLIVDDDENIRSLLEDLLDVSDFETDSVDSAEQALSMLKAKPFNIVITDHEMGGMDGFQLAQLIKSLYPEIFVIGISGNRTSSQFLAAGADVFVAKPLNVNELLTVIINHRKTSS